MASPVMVTVGDLAEQMGKDKHSLYEWARRSVDPLPLRYETGTRKNGCIDVAEFRDWWARNSVPYTERK